MNQHAESTKSRVERIPTRIVSLCSVVQYSAHMVQKHCAGSLGISPSRQEAIPLEGQSAHFWPDANSLHDAFKAPAIASVDRRARISILHDPVCPGRKFRARRPRPENPDGPQSLRTKRFASTSTCSYCLVQQYAHDCSDTVNYLYSELRRAVNFRSGTGIDT